MLNCEFRNASALPDVMHRIPHILVADDEPSIRMMLQAGLGLNGFQVTTARSGREALLKAAASSFDAVLSDIYMPDLNGLDLVRELREQQHAIPLVLMTAQASLEAAVEAVSRGATDFIAKPFEIGALVSLLRRCLDARRPAESSVPAPASDFSSSGLVGRSAAMAAVFKRIAQAARGNATVLITGESGTGKELAARAIHRFSSRAARPFVAVNCAGLTDTLLESELFGYVKGAFTGAAADRAGLFEAADSGTLFLDELASTSPAFQASLLRVLESGEVRRVGSTDPRNVDVRVIGASNQPLRALADAGTFRADLFYRLSVVSLDLPPLRQRSGDIELLAGHFLNRFPASDGSRLRLTPEAAAALAAYPFPGNVRELENSIRRAVALSSGGSITLDCLPPEISSEKSIASTLAAVASDRPGLDELQRRYLRLVLEECGGNRRRAAEVLKIDRRTVQRLIARYRLDSPADPETAPS